MQNPIRSIRSSLSFPIAAVAAALLAGCQSGGGPQPQAAATTAPKPAPTVAAAPAAPAAPVVAAAPAAAAAPAVAAATSSKPLPPVRIKAGPGGPFKDADGNAWLAEQGFEEGSTVDRADLEIANAKTPAIYRSECYSMTSFTYPVPNGKYTVKLHFCETFEGIAGPGERVFTFNVQGKEFKNFDVWAKTGGPRRAYVESVDVDVTDGKVHVTFTPQVENPEINGIEILPRS